MEVTYEQTRERLLEAAGEIFAEHGYKAATIRDICLRGQANIAAVNYHFGDKQALYIEAVKRAHCTHGDLINVVWPDHWTPQQKLREFIGRWLEHVLADNQPGWRMKLMLREMAEPTNACVQLVEAYIRPMSDTLRGIVRELVPGVEETRLGWMIGFSIVRQCLFYKVHRPVAELLMGAENYSQLGLRTLADHISNFSLAALGRGEPIVSKTLISEPVA